MLLRAAVDAPEPLSRMLAVTSLGLHLLCDTLRPGSAELGQTQDTPVSLLGSHYVSHRELADYSDGSSDRLQLQEICTFDGLEGPKNIRRVTQQVCQPWQEHCACGLLCACLKCLPPH